MIWFVTIMLWCVTIMIWFVTIMLWFVKIMIWFVTIMLWFVTIMLWFVTIMLGFVTIMLWFGRIMLCFVTILSYDLWQYIWWTMYVSRQYIWWTNDVSRPTTNPLPPSVICWTLFCIDSNPRSRLPIFPSVDGAPCTLYQLQSNTASSRAAEMNLHRTIHSL